MSRLPQAPEILVMHPDENRLRYVEFAADLETGEALTGTPTAVEMGTAHLGISDVARNGTKVNLRIDSSGVDVVENTLYRIKVTCATDQGNTLVCVGRLKITRDEGDTPAG